MGKYYKWLDTNVRLSSWIQYSDITVTCGRRDMTVTKTRIRCMFPSIGIWRFIKRNLLIRKLSYILQVIMGGGRRSFLPYNVNDPERGDNSKHGRQDGHNLIQVTYIFFFFSKKNQPKEKQ